MTTQHSVTLPTDGRSAPCSCGEEGCGTCCGLDTLIAPRYFCGQLLTDHDLTTQVEWTRDKLRLGRFRHGWGIVCGLGVRCDPERESGVIVTTGYAVSCCGDDVVVPEDEPFDLGGVCRRPDPCADLEDAGPAGRNGGTEQDGDTGDAEPADLTQVLARWRETLELQVVDLLICYRPEHTQPRPALAHDACGTGGACDYSRTRESFELVPRPVSRASDPVATAADDWREQYERCTDPLTVFRRMFSDLPQADAEDIREWLLDQPLEHFRFVHDVVRGLPADDLAEVLLDERTLALLLFLLVQDRRNTFLSCACHGCGAEHGVPLARIWLERRPWNRGGQCRVLRVDPYPPYRRPIRGECWPAPSGQVNAGRVIWHRWDEAREVLAGHGVAAVDTDLVLPGTLAELEQTLTCSPFVPLGQTAAAQVVDLDALGIGLGLGRRVVGFCGQLRVGAGGDGSPDVAPSSGEPTGRSDRDEQAQGAGQDEGSGGGSAATRRSAGGRESSARPRRPRAGRGNAT